MCPFELTALHPGQEWSQGGGVRCHGLVQAEFPSCAHLVLIAFWEGALAEAFSVLSLEGRNCMPQLIHSFPLQLPPPCALLLITVTAWGGGRGDKDEEMFPLVAGKQPPLPLGCEQRRGLVDD